MPTNKKRGGHDPWWRLQPWQPQSSANNNNETVVKQPPYPTSRFMASVQTIFKNWYHTAVGLPAAPIQNVWDGLKLAFRTMWQSYFSGFDAALFQYPQEGYHRWGVPGLVVGAAFGLGHWCVQVTGGVLMAASHVACGLFLPPPNPQYEQGMIWDVQEQTWKYYSLDQDKTTVDALLSSLVTPSPDQEHKQQQQQQLQQRSHSNLRKRKKQVKDLSYYHLLEVSADASASEIKRAYFKKSLQVHPDKTRNKETTSTFQHLTTVYQTLSNDQARELYDHHGMCWQHHPDAPSTSSSSLDFDAFVFFATLFNTSSVQVSAYTGTLAIATMVDQYLQETDGLTEILTTTTSTTTGDDNSNNDQNPKELLKDLQQQQRQIDVALYLRRLIHDFTMGRQSHEQFQTICHQEAHAVGNQGGQPYLVAIGTALQQVASLMLELEPITDRWIHATAGTQRRILSKLTTMLRQASSKSEQKQKQGTTAHHHYQETTATRENRSSNDEEVDEGGCQKEKESSGLSLELWMQTLSRPPFWKLLWEFHLDDVSTTMRLAARRVVWDEERDDHEDTRFHRQQQRAHALWILGNTFRNVATSNNQQQQQQQHHQPRIIDYNASSILELAQSAFLASIPVPQED